MFAVRPCEAVVSELVIHLSPLRYARYNQTVELGSSQDPVHIHTPPGRQGLSLAYRQIFTSQELAPTPFRH